MNTTFNKGRILLAMLVVSTLVFSFSVSAEEFGYNYLRGDLNVVQAVNYTQLNVNNSQYWNGNSWDAFGHWVKSGSNIYYNSGNVGIGTDSPVAKLQIGTTNGYSGGGDFYSFNNGGNPRFLFGDAAFAGNYGGLRWDSAGNFISLYTDTIGTSQLVLRQSGNIGMNTNNPQTTLDVNGTATMGKLIICDNGTATIMTRNETLAISEGCVL